MGTLLRALLRPATALFMRRRDAFKLLLIAAAFSFALAVAAWAQPFSWGSPAGLLVAAGWLAGLYFCAAFHVGSELSWGELRRAARALGHRDLREDAGLLTREEASRRFGGGQFAQAYVTLLDARDILRELVEEARSGAIAARDAADALARGDARLSARAQEEAATFEQSAASLARLDATVRENAQSCREASDLAADATRQARGGSEAARSAVATMDRIEESSRRIADIVGVIESIAFQTNILALNAAVEAARAGDEGRGFAVVASEVRALAQRCAGAAREVRGLVSGAVEGVDAGTRQVREAGRIIGEVTGVVESVNELLGVIAVASAEQAGAVGAVSRAVARLQSTAGEDAFRVRGGEAAE